MTPHLDDLYQVIFGLALIGIIIMLLHISLRKLTREHGLSLERRCVICGAGFIGNENEFKCQECKKGMGVWIH
jgi:hypothetical protein